MLPEPGNKGASWDGREAVVERMREGASDFIGELKLTGADGCGW